VFPIPCKPKKLARSNQNEKNQFFWYYTFKVEKKVTKGLPLVKTIWWIIEGTKKKKKNSNMKNFKQMKKMKKMKI